MRRTVPLDVVTNTNTIVKGALKRGVIRGVLTLVRDIDRVDTHALIREISLIGEVQRTRPIGETQEKIGETQGTSLIRGIQEIVGEIQGIGIMGEIQGIGLIGEVQRTCPIGETQEKIGETQGTSLIRGIQEIVGEIQGIGLIGQTQGIGLIGQTQEIGLIRGIQGTGIIGGGTQGIDHPGEILDLVLVTDIRDLVDTPTQGTSHQGEVPEIGHLIFMRDPGNIVPILNLIPVRETAVRGVGNTPLLQGREMQTILTPM